MSIQKKIVISLLIVLLCLIWWRTVFYGQKSGFKEIAVADGQTSFTADFDTDLKASTSRIKKQQCSLLFSF